MAYNSGPHYHLTQTNPYGGNMAYTDSFQHDDLTGLDLPYERHAIDPDLLPYGSSPAQLAQQLHSQRPFERFMEEPQRNLFTAQVPQPTSLPPFPQRRYEESRSIGSMANIPYPRYISPAPSHAMSSQPSSAQSPGADQEWYSDHTYSPHMAAVDDYSSLPLMTQNQFSEHHFMSGGFPSFVATEPCVSMNQVQAFQDDMFDDNEGYTAMSQTQSHDNNYTIEVDIRAQHAPHRNHHSYRYQNDGVMGGSIKSAGSPVNNSPPPMNNIAALEDHYSSVEDQYPTPSADDDVHGEFEAATPIDDEAEASDPEYIPQGTRTRKRNLSTNYAQSSRPAKRTRVVKASSKRAGTLTCNDCNHNPFKDAATLRRHINQAHLRPYICVFAFAGCRANFASKNEWKRHVSSQHLNLSAWVCTQGSCGRSSQKHDNHTYGAEFNRKDLFTQHLRRMHAPVDVKRKKTKDAAWEETLKDLQVTCLVVKRQAPARLECPLKECTNVFEGSMCWDEMMEHVGRHLDAVAKAGTGVVRTENDLYLLRWAETEGIIDRRPGGGWKLSGVSDLVGEEDAEGEDE